jgi:CPA1 family monovalent cation:H+ antiporter
MSCPHIDALDPVDPDPISKDGCVGCLAEGRDDWVHLRLCLDCGYVGCCDSSPRRHASRHFGDTQHPVMRSFEPGENWRWCFVDEVVG